MASCYHSGVSTKERLSASVDSDLIRAAELAVKRGLSASVSAWVNDALRLKLDQETRLLALSDFVANFEKEHGEISPDEIRTAERRARARAIPVRGLPEAKISSKRKKR